MLPPSLHHWWPRALFTAYIPWEGNCACTSMKMKLSHAPLVLRTLATMEDRPIRTSPRVVALDTGGG